MSTPTTVRVVAMSDKGFFIAVHDDGYCIFSLANSREVKLGDRLRGDFHGHSTFDASNLTRQDQPRIDLEDSESSLEGAIGHLLKFGSPECVYAGSKLIATNSDNVIIQIRDEILRSPGTTGAVPS